MAEALSIAAVKDVVAGHFGVSPDALATMGRRAGAAEQRHIAMFLARRLTGRSDGQIARAFGRRNPSTVLLAARKIERLAANDAGTRDAVAALAARLGGVVAA